jgi:hypothetical protein
MSCNRHTARAVAEIIEEQLRINLFDIFTDHVISHLNADALWLLLDVLLPQQTE